MKSQFLTILLLFFINFITIAQKQIVIQGANYTIFKTNIDSAIKYANNGDKIYIPGGVFNGFTLNKRLEIIGVGYHIDSTFYTTNTNINGDIYITNGADSSSLEGLNISNGYLRLNANINNFNVKKCVLSVIFGNFAFNNITFIQNFIGIPSNSATSTTNIGFYNNVISSIWQFNYATFKNNVIHSHHQLSAFNQIVGNNNLFENNIFSLQNTNASNNSIYRNNLSSSIANGSIGNGCVGYNNIIYSPIVFDSLFVKCNSNYSQYSVFINNSILRLRTNSPGKNAGTDGADIGIYGGAFPWKDGGIPSYPHIKYLNIGNTTDQNGKLKINIKVAAQDN